MKLLKAVGKVLSLPFDLVLIIGKLLLIPIKIISVLLMVNLLNGIKNVNL